MSTCQNRKVCYSKSDNGADLIVTTSTSVSNIQFEKRLAVQIKSYTGEHHYAGAFVSDILKKVIRAYYCIKA